MTSYMTLSKPGGIATFNANDGFVEAIVRGYRHGFLNGDDYRAILRCENLADVKLNLQETDYGNFMADVAEVTPAILREKATEKLLNEFMYLRSESGKI